MTGQLWIMKLPNSEFSCREQDKNLNWKISSNWTWRFLRATSSKTGLHKAQRGSLEKEEDTFEAVNQETASTHTGQIISECLFHFLNFPKKQWKIWQISAQEFKKWSNHKITAPYSLFNTLDSPYNHSIIRKCVYFVGLTTF